MNNVATLFNFVNLYLMNEDVNKKVILNIINLNDQLEFRLWFNAFDDGYSSMKLSKDVISNDDIQYLLNIFKKDNHFIERNNKYDKSKKSYNFYARLSNDRLLYLTNFSLADINKYHNMLFDCDLDDKRIKKKRYQKRLHLQEAGQTSYVGIISIMFLLSAFVLIAFLLYQYLY